MAGDLTVTELLKRIESHAERINASEFTARLKACESLDELQRLWSSLKDQALTDEEIVGFRRVMIEQKKRLLPERSLYGRLFEEVRREDFVSRHGSGGDELSGALKEFLGDRAVSDVALEEIGAFVTRWARETPRRYALFRLGREIKWKSLKGLPRADARDVFQLRDAIAECLRAITTTDKNAVDAFAEAFARAKQRIDAKRHGRLANAKKRAWRAQAWQDYKRSGFASYEEGARILEVHYREPALELKDDDVKKRVRNLADYFRKMGKAEGLPSKPGARPIEKRRKKAGVATR